MLAPGQVMHGRYRLVRPVGAGGFGTVYEAIDLSLNRQVALKQLLRSDERLSRQFTREAQLLANLHHPALPRVTDHFVDAAGPCLVMDYVAGDDLATLLAERSAPFPLDQVLTWADQLLDVLAYLHTRQPPIVHRDIKPQNLKLREDGAIMLLDFGLAKGMSNALAAPTTASILAYTKGFAPLEQVRGLGTDARSDLYSLGATLYCLLTRTPPIEAELRAYAANHHIPDELRSTLECTPQLPLPVAEVLLGALALERDDRPASAMQMRAKLRTARGASYGAADAIGRAAASRSEPTERAAEVSVATPRLPERRAPGVVSTGAHHESLVSLPPPASTSQPAAGSVPPWIWLAGGASIALILALVLMLGVVLLRTTAPVDRGAAMLPSAAPTTSASEHRAAVPPPTVDTSVAKGAGSAPIAATPIIPSAVPTPAVTETSAPETAPASQAPTVASTAAPPSTQPDKPTSTVQPVAVSEDLTILATASASSVLAPENTNCCGLVRYDAGNVLDGKLSTSWVEGESGSGIGHYLDLTFDRPISVTRIGVDVGFDRDAQIFNANNRLRRARFVFSDGSSQTLDFADVRGMQYAPLQNGSTTSLRIYIDEVFVGLRYDDTSVAEVEIWGHISP